MIEIKHLSKIFKPKSKSKTIALDDVNILLPNKGLVFVIGKSGSGKTTLLSLIGGLDSVSQGEIIVNGTNIVKLSHSRLDDYRNNSVGYIFQDYQLIENLTIFENLKMMLDFKNDEDDEKIKKALKEVDLEGYENRYPKELSGGQKQRISIARILVKNPSIILADEPTGNLDLKNTRQILNLLKSLANDHLVLVVSHDVFSANEFGDYILYLKQGKIINKYKRKDDIQDELVIKDDVLYLPFHKNINFENKNEIIEKLNENQIKDIIQRNDYFIPYEFDFKNEEITKPSKEHLSFFKSVKYGFKFYKGQGVKSLLFSLFISILLSFVSLFICVNHIDEGSQIKENLYKNRPSELALVAHDDSDNSVMNMSIFANEIPNNYQEAFQKAGYTGKIYEATNTDSDITLSNTYLKTPNYILNKYIKGEESYYKKLYGVNGELIFLDKNDIQYDDGIYVSDVFAYLFSRRNDITKRKTFYRICKEYNYLVNGIIKTDCETRFPNIYECYVKNYDKERLESLKNSDEYKLFPTMSEAFYYAGYGLSKDCFISNFNNPDSNKIIFTKNILKYENSSYHLSNSIITPSYYDFLPDLKDDEMIVDYLQYNLITGNNISSNFKYYKEVEPIEVDFGSYNIFDKNLENIKFNKKLKIVGVLKSSQNIVLSQNNKEEIVRQFDSISGLYFDDVSQIDAIIKGAEELDLIPIDYQVYTNRIGRRYIDTLHEFFTFIMIILIILITVGLIFYNLKVIHNRYFEIGVMKSLGCKDSNLMTMFSFNLILTYLKTMVFFNVFTYFLINIVNKILVVSINNVTSAEIEFISTNIIIFPKGLLFIFMNVVILLSFIIAYIIPFIKIRLLKPSNIVKAKE